MQNMQVELFIPSDQSGTDFSATLFPDLSHGAKVVEIISGTEDITNTDGLVTSNHSYKIGVRTADCAPICFADGKTIGIAHVGWRGLCRGLIENMLPHFNPGSLSIYVAPFLHSFEIKKDFCYDDIMAKFPDGSFLTQTGDKLIFNFKDAITSLLPPQAVFDERSTDTDVSFPSRRRGNDLKKSGHLFTVVSFPDV